MEAESLITSYRKNASYCRVKASRTRDAADKAKWPEFAETWERLANEIAREGKVISIDSVSRTKAKGQDFATG